MKRIVIDFDGGLNTMNIKFEIKILENKIRNKLNVPRQNETVNIEDGRKFVQ